MTESNDGGVQHRGPPTNGADESAMMARFTSVVAGLPAKEVGTSEQQRADANRLEQARKAGAQDERHWLARELHDSVGPALHSIGLLTRTALAGLTADQEEVRTALELVLTLSRNQTDEMRQLMTYMRADSLVEALSATSEFTREYAGMQVVTELGPEPPLTAAAKIGLYMIARETMHNAVKHAPGCRLLVRLERQGEHVVLDVSDDGPGFDVAAVPTGHYGLVLMRERAALLGARFEIDSAYGKGTRVRVAVPLGV